MAKGRNKAMLTVMLLSLAGLTTGAAFFWGWQVIAMPACTAYAQTQGLTPIGYRPVNRFGSQPLSRIHDINGSCLLIDRNGHQQGHDLTPELHGWKRYGAASLRYDLIFFVALVGWGLLIAMWPGDKSKQEPAGDRG